MTSRITPRARSRPDRAGDPLDGLVNLFDLGIVLSVAFLLAALSSLKLSDALTRKGINALRNSPSNGTIAIKPGQRVQDLRVNGQRVVGQGTRVGSVFRLADGRVVYVEGK